MIKECRLLVAEWLIDFAVFTLMPADHEDTAVWVDAIGGLIADRLKANIERRRVR